MTAEVLTVDDVQQVALDCGLREVQCVPNLHGSWWGRGVEVRCQTPWAGGLSICVLATVPGGAADEWRWRANVSAGIAPEDLAHLVRAAKRLTVSAVAS